MSFDNFTAPDFSVEKVTWAMFDPEWRLPPVSQPTFDVTVAKEPKFSPCPKPKTEKLDEEQETEAKTLVKKDSPNVPDGMEVHYTEMGEAYFAPAGDDGREGEAMEEHKRLMLPLLCSMDVIEENYGKGIWLYFDYVKCMIYTNFVLMILQFIQYFAALGIGLVNRRQIVSHFISLCQFPDGTINPELFEAGEGCPSVVNADVFSAGVDVFFITRYADRMQDTWLAMNILCVFVMFGFGPAYYYHVSQVFREKFHLQDSEGDFANTQHDLIKANLGYTQQQRATRYVASYAIFAGLQGIQALISFFITRAANSIASALTSIIITAVVTVINIIFKKLCNVLTNLEKHQKWSEYRTHNTVKFIIFKMLNVCMVYAAKQYDAPTDNPTCPIEPIAIQFFFLIMSDIVLLNGVELVQPVILSWVKGKTVTSGKGDEERRPEFDVSEEYLELLYRQYIVFMAIVVFPPMAFLAWVGSILEYYLDRYKLMRMCRRPHRTNASMKYFLASIGVLIAFFSLLTPQGGMAWVMSGVTSKAGNVYDDNMCPFVNNLGGDF